jgi:hypothetical protein
MKRGENIVEISGRNKKCSFEHFSCSRH